MTGVLLLSQKERDRLSVLRQVQSKHVSCQEAADVLGLSRKQLSRLLKRFCEEGDAGLIHRSKGKPSHHGYPDAIKKRVMTIYKSDYWDYGPSLFAEMLVKYHHLAIDHETLRRWIRDHGLTTVRRKKRPHRKKRERRQAIGALVQYDGSIHDWFEGRGPKCTLLHAIDDASGRVFLRFAPSENTADVLKMLWEYCKRYGIPKALYTDHDGVYYAPNRLTDVGRAMRELGVEMIFANSPQAKGRVERGNRTHQDRLIKALRRKRISTIGEANDFLEKEYLKDHNARFASTDGLPNVHRSTDGYDLINIFCYQTLRLVRNDYTISLDGVFVQLKPSRAPMPPPGQYVNVRRHLNDSLHITWREHELPFKPVITRPKIEHHKYVPRKDHPWRIKNMGFRKKKKEQSPVPPSRIRRTHK